MGQLGLRCAAGGKAVRNIPMAVACAVAADRLRRPVQLVLDRWALPLATWAEKLSWGRWYAWGSAEGQYGW